MEKNNKIKFKDLWGLGLIIFIVIFFILFFQYADARLENIENNGKATSGKVIEKRFAKRANIYVFEYWVLVTKYTQTSSSYDDIKIGECFLVKYLPTDPSEAEIFFDQPIVCN